MSKPEKFEVGDRVKFVLPKGKLLNVAIIVGCMSVGLGFGHAVGLGEGNLGSVPHAATPFAMIFGIVGAMVCVSQNNSRVSS